MIFTELVNLAEEKFGESAVDDILSSVELSTGGAYSAVGNYPCSELVAIVSAMSRATGIPAEDLKRAFGHHMLRTFARTDPGFFSNKPGTLELLEAIEHEVHVEVRKLYPEAELPTFSTERLGPGVLKMVYRSQRPLAHFCHGLIEAAAQHFNQRIDITVQSDPANPHEATFIVTQQG